MGRAARRNPATRSEGGGATIMHARARAPRADPPMVNEIVESKDSTMPKPKQQQKAMARSFSVIEGRHEVSMPMAFCAALPPRIPASALPLPAPISDLKSSDMAAGSTRDARYVRKTGRRCA